VEIWGLERGGLWIGHRSRAPIVAKIPVVMKPGAFEVYAFHVEDNTLSLTQQRNVRGPVEGRAATKLVRLE
jgi:hypothetical protein